MTSKSPSVPSSSSSVSSPVVSSLRLQNEVIVLTGASSGIGACLAHTLYREGAKVLLGARRLDKLIEVQQSALQLSSSSSPGVLVVQECNVTDAASVQALVDTAERDLGPVTVLINCAGVMYFTLMRNVHLHEWSETVDVNCKGVLHGLAAVLQPMIERGRGKIITISSDAGVRPVFPALAVYCASKAFCETLSEITRRELVGTGVTLTTICPGDVAGTELVLRNTDEAAAQQAGVEIGKPVGSGFSRNQLLDVQDVADAVLYALTAPPHVAINTVLIEARDQA
jgi:NADP-dependent 3-hydroxy acid dehydrogenase YdfG